MRKLKGDFRYTRRIGVRYIPVATGADAGAAQIRAEATVALRALAARDERC